MNDGVIMESGAGNNSKREKNHGVTIAKALAIILMVLGHSSSPDVVNNFLGIMRMPLFFLMSGYCFKDSYFETPMKYLKRRVTGVYVPYVKWGLFFLILHNVFCAIGLYNPTFGNDPDTAVPYSVFEHIRRAGGIVFALIANEELIGGYWFLHDLFWGSILFFFSNKFIKSAYVAALLQLILAFVLSYLDTRLSYFVFPRTALASFFLTIGHIHRKNEWHFERSRLFIVGVIVGIGVVSIFWHANMLTFKWMDLLPYAMFAVLGSLMLFGLGQRLNKMQGRLRNFLIFTGGKTFNVLTWHMISFKIVSLLIVMIYGLEWGRLAEFTTIKEYAHNGWSPLYFIVGVSVPLLWSYGFDKLKAEDKGV